MSLTLAVPSIRPAPARRLCPQLQPDAWYLAVPEGPGAARGGVAMVDGTRAAQVAARGSLLAQVLFLARPPQKDVPDQGHNLLQL